MPVHRLPLPLMRAAEAVWADEKHVEDSRARYVAKYEHRRRSLRRDRRLRARRRQGSFCGCQCADGEAAALKLWTATGVRVLPGEYLSRDVNGENPGKGYIRVAMVAEEQEMRRGLEKLRDCLFE